MKRIASILLALCLLVGLTACGDASKKPYDFSGLEEFTDHVEGEAWVAEATYDDVTYYRIRLFTQEDGMNYCLSYDLKAENGESYEEMITRMLKKMKEEGVTIAYEIDDVFSFILDAEDVFDLFSLYSDVTYDWENGVAKNDMNTWDFSDGTTMTNHGETYEKDDDLWKLKNAFVTAYGDYAEAEKKAFLSKYPNLASYKDVAYDFYGHIGQNFRLEGTLELDDYFNYEYRGLDAVYFCICVTPPGGSFSDRWYIYAERSTFKDLFETLKDGSVSNVTLICQALFPDAGSHRMATLVDYCVG